MLQKMLDYALKHSASQPTPHRIFYNRFGRDIHSYPNRIISDAIEMLPEKRSRLESLGGRGRRGGIGLG